jgi:flagellar biosynthesis protein FlhB
MTAEADLVGAAWLVSVTVTVCVEEKLDGALYKTYVLIEHVPEGLMDQVTAVLLTVLTLAENCCV